MAQNNKAMPVLLPWGHSQAMCEVVGGRGLGVLIVLLEGTRPVLGGDGRKLPPEQWTRAVLLFGVRAVWRVLVCDGILP